MRLAPGWLTSIPIAHRGAHDAANGIIENSLSAARHAVGKGVAIECDVQLSADGEAMVFHDDDLARLCGRNARIGDLQSTALSSLALLGSSDHIPSLADLCAQVAGRVPIVCEIKSHFDGNMRLARRVAAIASTYAGPICIESFDPAVMTYLRTNPGLFGDAAVPLGMVAQANYDDEAWSHLSADQRHGLAQFLHYEYTQPDFLSYCVQDLPHAVPFLCRTALRMPVTAWTVRTAEDLQRATQWADQIVFEGDLVPSIRAQDP